MRVLGINAVFHDPAAALVIDGATVAAAEEERFSRRKHGKVPVPFSTWEVPGKTAAWCLKHAGLSPADLDAVAYSYDPDLAPPPTENIAADDWEGLRTLYARRGPLFLRAALPGLDPERVRFVPHHVAHAASAYLAAPYPSSSAPRTCPGGRQTASWRCWPPSLCRTRSGSCVRSLPSTSAPSAPRMSTRLWRWLPMGNPRSFPSCAGSCGPSATADLAASVQARLEEVLLDLIRRLHEKTGDRILTMAGGVALNCVANSRLAEQGPFDHIWVQPASGDSETALGAAMYVARTLGDCLIVCLNSDESVRRIKGSDRPLVPEEDRATVLRALSSVDAVVLFNEDTPEDVLSRLRPDVFAKGGDYAVSELPEARLLARWGGRAVILPYVAGRSTTRLIEEAVTRGVR